jgi:UDP-glucose 4-epimerase
MALYVVTGGAGFIGSHLTDALLAQGHRVRVLDDLSTGNLDNLHPAAEFTHGDVADTDTVRSALAGAEGCFHLAAIASVARGNEDWIGTHRVNLGGTITVLEAARDAGRIPVVYASSAAVYGDQGPVHLHEDMVPQPLSAYGADKFGGELHARVALRVHATPTTGLRFFNVYGPRQDPRSPYSGVISIFAERALNRRTITINGDGMQTRDFVFVGDVVEHLQAAMRRLHRVLAADVFNVCTGLSTSILGLAETLGELTGWVPDVAFAPARAGDIQSSLGNPDRALEALGIGLPTSLGAGLAALLESMHPRSPPAPARGPLPHHAPPPLVRPFAATVPSGR